MYTSMLRREVVAKIFPVGWMLLLRWHDDKLLWAQGGTDFALAQVDAFYAAAERLDGLDGGGRRALHLYGKVFGLEK